MRTGADLAELRERKPLVHQITNYVVMNETANATLALGALCAIIAAGVQGATRKKNPLKGQRIAAGLLAVAVICMAIARFVGF